MARWTRFTRDAQGLHFDGMWGGPDQFADPYAVALDQNDNIFVADQTNNRVKIVKITNNVMATVTVFSNVTATDTLKLPQSIAVDDRDPQAVTGYVVDAHDCKAGVQRLFKFTFANNAIQNVTPWAPMGGWSTDDGFKLPLTANSIVTINTAPTPTVEQLGPGAHRLRLRVLGGSQNSEAIAYGGHDCHKTGYP